MLGLPEVDRESAKDPEVKELRKLVAKAKDWVRHLRDYFVKDTEYSVAGNLVLVANRVVIQKTLMVEVLVALCHSHSGMRVMQARAREALY